MLIQTIPSIITEDERLKARSEILAMSDLWKPASPTFHAMYGSQYGVFYTLGDALYVFDAENYTIDQLDRELRHQLITKFGWLFDRIMSGIEQITGLPTSMDNQLTSPGFHISTVRCEIEEQLHFHTDISIARYKPHVDLSKVVSAVIPIELPAIGAGLEYLDNNGESELFMYTEGHFHAWYGGTVKHRIRGLKCDPDEYRITLQCHSYYDPHTNTNKVFF